MAAKQSVTTIGFLIGEALSGGWRADFDEMGRGRKATEGKRKQDGGRNEGRKEGRSEGRKAGMKEERREGGRRREDE